MIPDSWGRALLLAIGKAGTGRVTDGCGYYSYWAPSITVCAMRLGRNWGTAQHSPFLFPFLFLFPFPLPALGALAQLRTAWDG